MKVAGTNGEFGQLLMKARFEEAKIQDLVDPVSNVFYTGPTQQIKVATHPLKDPITHNKNTVTNTIGHLTKDLTTERWDILTGCCRGTL